MAGAAGVTETEFTTGAATVMVAEADLVVSATLVAVIVAVPAVAAAVKRPLALIVPDEVFQVTDLLEALPCTLAESWSVPPVRMEPVAGVTATEETGTGAAVIVTVADEDFVGSATLVAVMVAVPVLAGAVKTPEEEIEPFEAVQVTVVFVTVPCTEALKECVSLTATLAVAGETLTELTTGAGGGFDGGGFVGGGLLVGATPVAESGTTVGVALALLISARLPVMVPGVSGVNATAKVFAEPGATVAGRSSPEVLKPEPVTVT